MFELQVSLLSPSSAVSFAFILKAPKSHQARVVATPQRPPLSSPQRKPSVFDAADPSLLLFALVKNPSIVIEHNGDDLIIREKP
jgi:hypothetical protein